MSAEIAFLDGEGGDGSDSDGGNNDEEEDAAAAARLGHITRGDVLTLFEANREFVSAIWRASEGGSSATSMDVDDEDDSSILEEEEEEGGGRSAAGAPSSRTSAAAAAKASAAATAASRHNHIFWSVQRVPCSVGSVMAAVAAAAPPPTTIRLAVLPTIQARVAAEARAAAAATAIPSTTASPLSSTLTNNGAAGGSEAAAATHVQLFGRELTVGAARAILRLTPPSPSHTSAASALKTSIGDDEDGSGGSALHRSVYNRATRSRAPISGAVAATPRTLVGASLVPPGGPSAAVSAGDAAAISAEMQRVADLIGI